MATVIFKPTDRCNSNCAYCSVLQNEHNRDMADDVLETLFRRINEYLVAHPHEHVDFTWHGGEPLLLGPAYFDRAWQLQQQYCPATKGRIKHLIQSNLTLFHEGFVEPFRRLGIEQVGSSYEPIPNVRGPGPRRDSDRYNQMFLEAVARLEELGFGWGIIYTVTRLSLKRPIDIFYFTTNLNTRHVVRFNYVQFPSYVKNDLALTPEEYAEFLGTIFQVWWPARHRFPGVLPFEMFLRQVNGAKAVDGCWHSGRCADSHLGVGPQGQISNCGRSLDYRLIDYGNIRDKSFDEVFRDPLRQRARERDRVLPEADCRGCRFWSLCHGLCPLDAYEEHGDFNHRSRWCPSTKIFLEKYFEPVTGLRYQCHG